METGLRKQDLIAELSRSPHAFSHLKKGEKRPKVSPTEKFKVYVPVCKAGAIQEPEFFARLMSWNLVKGQVKDSRVALPPIALSAMQTWTDGELAENALAHMAALDPRLFVRALTFLQDLKVRHSRVIQRLVERYVRDRETDRSVWNKTMVQHRRSMEHLYMRYRIAPGGKPKGESYEWNVLNGRYENGSVFEAIENLKSPTMPMNVAAELIAKFKISPLISLPALGEKAKDPNVLLEMIKSMSPTELVTSMKLLEKLGVRQEPMLRAALDEALKRVHESKKSTLKTSKAAEAVGELDEVLSAKLKAAQEKQIDAISSVEGNWAILGDKSGSMNHSIEIARQVTALLTRSVKGEVHLVFFDTSPYVMNSTGKTFEEIQEMTRRVTASGGTSIGVGLNALFMRNFEVDGVVIVSDGAEHQSPYFTDVYKRYCEKRGKQLPVYFYRVPGEPDSLSGKCNMAGIELTTFDVATSVDYYSLPNMIQTMRVNHYSLLDEIMQTPMLKLNEVLSRTEGMEVIRHARAVEAAGR